MLQKTRPAATGLSKEARQRDKSNPVLSGESQPLTGREVEAAVAERNEIPAPLVESLPEEEFVAPDPQTLGVTRRQFFNRSLVGMMGFGLSGFGAACIAFLWPQGVSGFGSKIKVGNIVEILAEIDANNGFLYNQKEECGSLLIQTMQLKKHETLILQLN